MDLNPSSELVMTDRRLVSLREKGVDLNICLIKSYEEGDVSLREKGVDLNTVQRGTNRKVICLPS